MENTNEGASTYRPRTGSLERKRTASATTKKAVKSADTEERPKRVYKAKEADDAAPAKRTSARQSFFKTRATDGAPRDENLEEKPKRAPRKTFSNEDESPKRRLYNGDNDRPAPRRKFSDGEERPKRRSAFDSFSKERPRTDRRSKDSNDRDERPKRAYGDKPRRSFSDDKPRSSRPYEKKPYEKKTYGEDKPRRSFSDDKPRSSRPYEKKAYERKPYGERPFSEDSKRPRRNFEDKPRKDIRVWERKPKLKVKDPNEPVRLNKFIANSGVSSRREADEYIQNGEITVNGVVITELGTKVMPNDDIRWNGQKLSGEKKVYILLNKPKGYVTTVEDPHAERTVMDLIESACTERVYPVGRLDKNTTGVLLFTNDGDITKVLTHPSYNKRKVYQVTLDKTLKKPDLEQLVKGVELEDGLAIADEVGYSNLEDKKEVGLEIHSGRNRIVRRMFEALGYEVKKLDRVYFAGLTKKSLERGKWRMLTPKEVSMLKMGAYE